MVVTRLSISVTMSTSSPERAASTPPARTGSKRLSRKSFMALEEAPEEGRAGRELETIHVICAIYSTIRKKYQNKTKHKAKQKITKQKNQKKIGSQSLPHANA